MLHNRRRFRAQGHTAASLAVPIASSGPVRVRLIFAWPDAFQLGGSLCGVDAELVDHSF